MMVVGGGSGARRGVPQQRIVEKLDEYMSRRDLAGAERHLLYWLEEARSLEDKRGELMIRNELVGHFRKTANRQEALLHAEEALSLIDELGFKNTLSAGTTYVNVATACNAFGEDERSFALFAKAAQLYETAENADKRLLGGLYNNMALACVSLCRFDEATALFGKALAAMQDVEHGELECAITYLNMADALVAETAERIGSDEQGAMLDEACEQAVEKYLDLALDALDTPSVPRDGYYAFVCEKCAGVFGHYGYFLADADLRERARVIYERP